MAANERVAVRVAHPSSHLRREYRAKTSAAVHDHFRVLVRYHRLDIPLEDTLAQVNGTRRVAGQPFPVLADIHQDSVGIVGKAFARLGRVDLVYTRPRFINDRQETGSMLHGRQNAPPLGRGQP